MGNSLIFTCWPTDGTQDEMRHLSYPRPPREHPIDGRGYPSSRNSLLAFRDRATSLLVWEKATSPAWRALGGYASGESLKGQSRCITDWRPNLLCGAAATTSQTSHSIWSAAKGARYPWLPPVTDTPMLCGNRSEVSAGGPAACSKHGYRKFEPSTDLHWTNSASYRSINKDNLAASESPQWTFLSPPSAKGQGTYLVWSKGQIHSHDRQWLAPRHILFA